MAYIRAILSQDAAYFDKNGSGEIAARGAKEMDIISKGYGEHLGWMMWLGGYAIGSIVVSATSLPKLFGGLLALVLTTALMIPLLGRWAGRHQRLARKANGKANTFLEQCISGIRVVQTFGMRSGLVLRLEQQFLIQDERSAVKQTVIQKMESGFLMTGFFLISALSTFYGGRLIQKGATLGQVMACSCNLGNLLFKGYACLPHLTGFREAQHSLQEIRQHIERQPLLDVRDEAGLILMPTDLPAEGKALVEFENVAFAYPSRPGMKALDRISFVANAGELTALVGPSGAGKSSIGALLLREYDPATADISYPEDEKDEGDSATKKVDMAQLQDLSCAEKSMQGSSRTRIQPNKVVGQGIIRFGAHDVRICNLKSLRSQISIVHQDPQLLSGTILENVTAGLADPDDHQSDDDSQKTKKEELVRDRCVEALRSAEAWDFVAALPDGVDTIISGGRTTMLSGGQQQRIALARALVRRPVLLILDEATSALSSDIEMKIRRNLERIQEQSGLTIISVAHRLQFAQAAHKVIVMDQGRIVSEGTFETLSKGPRFCSTFADLINAHRSDARSVDKETCSTLSETTLDTPPGQFCITQGHPKDFVSTQETLHLLRPGIKRRVLSGIGNRKWLMILAFTLGISLVGLQTGRFIVQGRAQGKMSGNTNDTTSTDTYGLIFAIAAIPVGLVTWGLDGLAGISAKRTQRILAVESAKNLLQQEISYFEGQGTSAGTLTALLSKHTGRVAALYTIISSKLLGHAGLVVAALSLGMILNWKFAVFSLTLVGPAVGLGALQVWADVNLEATHEPSQALVSAALNEAVDAIRTIAATGQQHVVVGKLEQVISNAQAGRHWLMVKQSVQALSLGIPFIGGAVFWRRSSWLYAKGEISVAALFAVLEASYAVIMTFPTIVHHLNGISQAIQSWLVLRVYLVREPRYHSRVSSSVSEEDYTAAIRGDVVFSNVSMTYPTRRDALALDGLNLCLQAGKVTALTGPSGGGKSTILALVQRFYDQPEGNVEFGGMNSQAIPLEALQSHLAIVSQNSVLFEGDIWFNLCLGARNSENVLRAEIEYVCKEACILDFIQSLPEGFSTDIGLKGTRLSGGQRQRLCIARALLRNPRILLLDEATSSLDAVNEAEVEKALQNASKGRTVIVVAHKLQSIKNADKICVIESGKLVECGQHEELIERKSRYYELVKSQL